MTILPKTKKVHQKDRDKVGSSASTTSFCERTRTLNSNGRRLKHSSDTSSSHVLSPPVKKANHRSGSQSPTINSDDEGGFVYRSEQEEGEFSELLRVARGWQLKEMQGDGACLFRGVADQVYGDQEMHTEVRRLCMDYMERNRDHFSQFITEDFNDYVRRKRDPAEHGNHVEMQAISEIYGRTIEIYQYGLEPINTFHPAASAGMNAPLRLSYHRNNHYNAIIDPLTATIGVGLGLPGLVPGAAEAALISDAVHQSEALHLEETMLNDKIHMTDWERTEEDLKDQVARESYLEYLRNLDGPGQSSIANRSTSKSPNRKRTLSNGENTSRPSCSGTSATQSIASVDKPCSSKQAGLYEELLAMGAVEWPDGSDEDAMMAQAILMSQQQFMEDLQKRENTPGSSRQS